MSKVHLGEEKITYVADQFEAIDVGAPFRVILHDAVRLCKDGKTGEILSYSIPDLDGLIVQVVISRVLDPRKLFAGDIKFIRRALGLKQKDLANKLEVSVEHLSRCETGAHPMSPSTEKLLRILSVKSAMKLNKIKSGTTRTRLEDALDRLFDAIKPVAVFDVDDILELHFWRAKPSSDGSGTDDVDDGNWEDNRTAA